MVWSQESEAERPPLSVILPQLYLGAERDVTQECLSSLGISYVLSVSRCSPQPAFLPSSSFLRIPIDDSLWDDLLPWIPQALHFIDAAMSSGASVLVHCAAGISRSPALAVAYIMYKLDLDLDRAYRFVKERRPTISPNFNFLGQLQHFQATLSRKAPGGGFFIQGQGERVAWPPGDRADPPHSGSEDSGLRGEKPQQKLLFTDVNGNQQQNFLDVNRQSVGSPPQPRPSSPPALKLSVLRPPPGSASLLDKRKSLTLSLSPAGSSPAPTSDAEHPSREAVTQRGGGEAPRSQCGRAEAKEAGLLSPFSLTLNKLIGWGERILLGGVFLPPVRMGQPALPYRC